MLPTKKHTSAAIIFALTAILLLSGCKIYKDETSQISGIDEQACETLSDTTVVGFTSMLTSDYNAHWLNANVSAFADTLLDNLLQDTIVVEQGSAHPYEIILPNTNDTSYVAVKVTPGARTFFLTNFVNILLLSPAGQPMDFVSDEMPLTTVSGCTVADAKGHLSPHIKIRYQYDVDVDTFLMVIEKNDQTVVDATKKAAIVRIVVY